MNNVSITETTGSLRFCVSRSMRYHERRVAFYSTMLGVSQWLEAILGASAFTILMADMPVVLAKWIVAISTAISIAAVILKSSERVKHHMGQKSAMASLLQRFPVDLSSVTEDTLKELRNERLEIEKSDGVILDCLNVICHNEQCVADGTDHGVRKLSWFQSRFGAWLPIPYTNKTESKQPTSS